MKNLGIKLSSSSSGNLNAQVIECKRHKKEVRYICSFQGCQTGNLICETCLVF